MIRTRLTIFTALALAAAPIAGFAAGADAPFSGRAPTHIDGSSGDGPKLHVPEAGPNDGTRSAANTRLGGGDGAGGAEVVRDGEGSGTAGAPAGVHLDNGSGAGPEVHRYGPAHNAR